MAPVSSRLAVDISGTLIRVLDGVMGGAMRAGSTGLPNGALVGGKVIDTAAVAQALKQLMARTEITDTRAWVGVSDAIATFRVLGLPTTATDKDVAAAVARELPLDPERIAVRWVDLFSTGDSRAVYAVAWDRALLRAALDAVRLAGVDPVVVELKSAAIARAVMEPSCVIVDLTSEPVEIVLVEGNLPRVWHGFNSPAGDDLTTALAGPLRSVLRFHGRRHGGGFGPNSPVLLSGEQIIAVDELNRLADLIEQPVTTLPAPQRVPGHVRHATYLTCLGLMMRRT